VLGIRLRKDVPASDYVAKRRLNVYKPPAVHSGLLTRCTREVHLGPSTVFLFYTNEKTMSQLIPVVTFLAPLASNFEGLKDR
jgi:hypothetical protein